MYRKTLYIMLTFVNSTIIRKSKREFRPSVTMIAMLSLRRHAKRLATDGAGYGLIVLGIALGWLPGPGGIPLVLAGLGLLSINNAWAARLRDYLLKQGGRLVQLMFPGNPWVQLAYDLLALALGAFAVYLVWQHDAVWQISVGIIAFFMTGFIALMNRRRLARFHAPRP